MKSYIKGVIIGIVLSVCISLVPVIGDTIDVLFNQVRININGIDRAQWGEDFTLEDGTKVPYSILYKGTTYLPLRKMGEFTNKYVAWNGDTQTVTLVDRPQSEKILTEKPDKNGNVWTYYTFETSDKTKYLGVKDEKRGYERVYQLIGDTVKVTDDRIYFMRTNDPYIDSRLRDAELVSIDFANDTNTQDGTILHRTHSHGYVRTAIFDGDYVYYMTKTHGTMSRIKLTAYNYITETYAYYDFPIWSEVHEFEIVDSSEESTTFEFVITRTGMSEGELVFDKTTNTFLEATMTEVITY